MKKSSLAIYGFYNFYFNYFIQGIGPFDKSVKCIINKTYSIKDRINGLLVVMLCLCIYTLINLLIYKFVTRKHKLSKVYLLIPLFTMALGIIAGASLFILRSYELSMH